MRIPLPALSLLLFPLLAVAAPAQDWLNMGSSNGDNPRDLHGWSLAPLANYDGNGQDVFLIGTIGEDTNGSNCGSVTIADGLNPTPLLQVFGESAGDLLGVCVVGLPDLDGGGKADFAAGAPWHDGGGFFAGKFYVFRGEDGTVLDAIEGTAGEILGVSLAAVDFDNDGITELLVGAVGAESMAGVVRIYQPDSEGILTLEQTVTGDSPGDWLGYSLSTVRDPSDQPSGLFVVGVPFLDKDASTLDSGGAYLYLTTPAAAFVRFREYLGNTPGAGVGYSVNGRLPTFVSALIAAGGPFADGPNGTDAGQIMVWEATQLSTVETQIDGSTAGDRLGVATLLLDDINFDGQIELLAAAPYANSQAGRVEVLDLQKSPPEVLNTFDGTAGERLGWSAAHLGDLNGSTWHDLALGAPRTSSTAAYQGSVQLWSPPDSPADPLALSLLDPVTRGADVRVQVQNVKEGADLYFYLGTNQTPTTSTAGFDLDIGGLQGDGLGNDYQILQTGVIGGTATASISIPASTPPGVTLHFQTGELRGPFLRKSNADQGEVQDQAQTLSIPGDPVAGQTLLLSVTFAQSNKNLYFLAGTTLGNAGINFPKIVDTGLGDPNLLGTTVADSNGDGSFSWPVPPAFGGIILFFSAVSSDGAATPNEKLTVIGPFTVQ